MPGRATVLSETQIIADILREQRRQRSHAIAQLPQWTYDTFAISGAGDTTHTLTYVPYGINVAALNGLAMVEGVDYTADYATGIVTVTETLVAGDVLHIRYVTNGDLIALSGPVDLGLVPVTDTFNRADTTPGTGGLGTTSDGTSTWTDRQFGGVAVWQITSNKATVNSGAGAAQIATLNPPYSSANGTVAVDASSYSIGDAAGLLFRWSSNTAFWIVEALIGTNASNVYKVNYPTFTSVGTFTSTGAAETLAVTLSGSSIIVTQNGSTVVTVTDSYNSTATVHGMWATSGLVALDNFNWTPA